MKNNINRKALLASAALGSFVACGLLVHMGCKGGGEGGGNNQFTQALASIGGQVGTAVTGRQEVGRGIEAVANYSSKINVAAQDEDAMGQSVALSHHSRSKWLNGLPESSSGWIGCGQK